MDQKKIDQMRATLNKLEDIKNSQESIIDKINHVITDLFQHPDKELEKAMESAHQNLRITWILYGRQWKSMK